MSYTPGRAGQRWYFVGDDSICMNFLNFDSPGRTSFSLSPVCRPEYRCEGDE